MLRIILKITTLLALTVKPTVCTISGLSYMDHYSFRPYQNIPPINPCNTLFWYPRQIPDSCYDKITSKPKSGEYKPMPLPVPVPLPQPIPMPMVPNYPLPFGVPLAPTNPMVPIPGYPYSPYHFQGQAGMVPGIPGIVSPDGGINILPFSDVYADVIEKNKRKRLNRRMGKIIRNYEGRWRSRL